jgi:hypothetical protein
MSFLTIREDSLLVEGKTVMMEGDMAIDPTSILRSYWIPGSYETSSSMSAPSNALPRFRTL